MLSSKYPLWVGGQLETPNHDLVVFDKFSGLEFARVPLADAAIIDRALALAESSRAEFSTLAPHKRRDILRFCAARFTERSAELAVVLVAEAGKPLRDAKAEVDRLIGTFEDAADAALQIGGEYLPMEDTPRSTGYFGMTRRVPVGVCSFITPFNFPLNLVAHKVAPAIAAGCPFILKPASLTPVSALIVAEILADAGMPEGSFSVLPTARSGAAAFTEDPRPKLLSFTGSPEVGWALKSKAGKKRVVLELGGNAAVIIDETADLEDCLERLMVGSFSNSGQSCISVQRILVHESRYEELKEQLVARTSALVVGNPAEPATCVGPLISEAEAARLDAWVREAVAAGATVLCGGSREGTLMQPTLLEGVPHSAKLYGEEAFGPVALLERFSDFEAALETANQSRFGLQAGVFTSDLDRAMLAWERLEVGGVIIGDVPAWRADSMPYGGVKDSGLGREGVRFAIEDMTEPRLLVMRRRRRS